MLRRVAHELFWMGRYLERADCIARFLFAQRRLALEVGYLAHSPRAWTDLVLTYLGDGTELEVPDDPDEVVAIAVLSKDAPSSLLRCVERAHENARSARASISRETYESVHRLFLLLRQMSGAVGATPAGAMPPVEWSFALQRIGEACRVVSGYLADTVVRDDIWQVLHAGRHLERALQTLRTVRCCAVNGEGRPWRPGEPIDPVAWGGLLRSCSAYEAYRKVYRGPVEPQAVLELLLFYPAFPRSLRGAVGLLRENLVALRLLEAGWRPSPVDLRFGRLQLKVAGSGLDGVLRDGLFGFLDEALVDLAALGSALDEVFLTDELHPPDTGDQ